MKAVQKHTECKWVLLYIKRWLEAPIQLTDGSKVIRGKGTPQGSILSPVLSNLFLHYVFDRWMQRNYPLMQWCRYADDGLIHCKTGKQAKHMLEFLNKRFNECGLQLHLDKTKIIYCKDDNRKSKYSNTSFDFLGYTFRPRSSWNKKQNILFVSFTPSVSKTAIKSMRAKLKTLNIRKRSEIDFEDIAQFCNPILRGWINYYGRFNPSGLYPIFRYFNMTLSAWVQQKYKRLYRRKMKATQFLERIVKERPKLFAHWEIGMIGALA